MREHDLFNFLFPEQRNTFTSILEPITITDINSFINIEPIIEPSMITFGEIDDKFVRFLVRFVNSYSIVD